MYHVARLITSLLHIFFCMYISQVLFYRAGREMRKFCLPHFDHTASFVTSLSFLTVWNPPRYWFFSCHFDFTFSVFNLIFLLLPASYILVFPEPGILKHPPKLEISFNSKTSAATHGLKAIIFMRSGGQFHLHEPSSRSVYPLYS